MLCSKCEAVRFPPAQATHCTEPGNSRTVNTASHENQMAGRSKNKSTIANPLDRTDPPNQDQCDPVGISDAHTQHQQTVGASPTSGACEKPDSELDECCPRCLLSTASNKRRMKCDICQHIYHQQCTAISAKVFDKFVTNVNITGWVCDECKIATRSTFSRLETAIAHLAEELIAIKLELADVKSQSRSDPTTATTSPAVGGNAPTSTDYDNERTVMVIQRTLNDSARRKRNVVLCGIPETNDDRAAFVHLCEDNLPVKPTIGENSCTRIGKKVSGKPRLLRVRLDSDEAATAILRAAPLLRHSEDEYIAKNVYINPDLSPAAAKLAYEARQLRRTTRRQPRDSARDDSNTGASIGQCAGVPHSTRKLPTDDLHEMPHPMSSQHTTSHGASAEKLLPAAVPSIWPTASSPSSPPAADNAANNICSKSFQP